MYFAESSPAPLEPQPLPRRRRSPRPAAPPPYPGRSIILNYDYDDPQSWKNNLDKPQVVSSLTKSSEDEDTTPGLPGTTPARAATPVAAGAVLTLAELKRKQMCKRLAKLAASGKADNGNSEKEEDVDSAEASLELKLRRLIARVRNVSCALKRGVVSLTKNAWTTQCGSSFENRKVSFITHFSTKKRQQCGKIFLGNKLSNQKKFNMAIACRRVSECYFLKTSHTRFVDRFCVAVILC